MNNIIKGLYYSIICIALAGIQMVFAADNFQNNLLKTDVNKNSLGAVKVTLYTNKPYTDNIVANKKSDTEYVILMPETSNSIISKPSLQAVSDVVKNVEVKTQHYSGNVKGYTKIIITTSKPIEIMPRVQTLSSSQYKVSEGDYKELLEQSSKLQAKPVVKPAEKIAKKTQPSLNKMKASDLLVQKQEKQLFASKRTILLAKSAEPKKIERVAEFSTKSKKKIETKNLPNKMSSISKPSPSSTQYAAKKAQPQPLPVVEKIEQPVAQTPTHTQQAQAPEFPVAQVPATQSTLNQAEKIQDSIDNSGNEQLVNEIEEMSKPEIQAEQQQVLPYFDKLQKIKKIIKNNLYLFIGFCAIMFLLLVIAARNMTKSVKTQKESFVSHLDEKPVTPINLAGKITEDMTWREKFQTYVDATESQEQESNIAQKPDLTPQSNDLNDLFVEPSQAKAENISNEPEVVTRPENLGIKDENIKPFKLDEFIVSDINDFGARQDVSIDELFPEDEKPQMKQTQSIQKPQTEPVYQQSVQEVSDEALHQEIVKSKFVIDDGKGFYLVDFEDSTALVGQIGDKIFVLKRFGKKIDAKLQARMDETKPNSTSYMTRVGNFKGLVEVTPEKMKLLIEL